MDPMLFALGTSHPFAERMAAHLGWTLAEVEERVFDGGEHKSRPLAEVGGRGVFVVHSLYGAPGCSANDKLVRLLFFLGTLRDAGAARVTAVVPYLAYSRKDRRTKPRDPVNTRNVALLFDAMRTDAIVTVEVHNASAFENAFRACRPEHVPVAGLLADHLAATVGDGPLAVVTPDLGGAKRAELLRHQIERRVGRSVEKALVEKHRSAGVVSGSLFAGNVDGATAIVVDDLISSGGTLVRAAAACREHGARKVVAAAAHGLFTGGAPALFGPDGPDEVIVTDTVPVPEGLPDDAARKVRIVSVAGLIADVVGRLHCHDPMSDLIPYD
jgi:ribose-phosphate pyrophosphokinase